MQWYILGVIATAGVAALWGAWWLWWRLPKQQVDRLRLSIRDPKARIDVEDNFRKTMSQLLGGAAVLIGAGAAYLQFSQQQRASHDLLISNQVAKGFEQLGSNKMVVRLGGIYALEGVMNGSEQYHQAVLEALSAFVRESTKSEKGQAPPATDIQAALTVIGRRAAIGTAYADLNNVHIRKADLSRADLSHSDLSHSDLSGAFMFGVDLRDAYLLEANLRGAFLSIDRSRTDPKRANLIGANLNHANLNETDLTDADLSRTTLNDADLSGANLSRTTLNGTDLSGANLSRTILNGADLSGATVSQAQLDNACGTGVGLNRGLSLKQCAN